MMTIVTDREEIADLVSRFRQTIYSKLEQEVPAFVGYKGGGMEMVLRWSDGVQMWMTYDDAEDKEIGRFWVAFGLDRPFEGQNMSITTEINFPLEGCK